ncbi:MAG: roadblock/LC7 domain-containing protein [Myxococcota bacterium]|jgi:predicted regulator of Ras-like GTPase activity (Roadblock/LC7/MglB family)
MAGQQLVLHEIEFNQIRAVCNRLVRESNSRVVMVIDRNGQVIAGSDGSIGMDVVSLGSLVAGDVAATAGLAKLLGEREFSVLFHEGERDHLHITLVGPRVVLAVIFDGRSTLGLVRLRVKKAAEDVGRLFEMVEKRSAQQSSNMSEITEADIDTLFSEL